MLGVVEALPSHSIPVRSRIPPPRPIVVGGRLRHPEQDGRPQVMRNTHLTGSISSPSLRQRGSVASSSTDISGGRLSSALAPPPGRHVSMSVVGRLPSLHATHTQSLKELLADPVYEQSLIDSVFGIDEPTLPRDAAGDNDDEISDGTDLLRKIGRVVSMTIPKSTQQPQRVRPPPVVVSHPSAPLEHTCAGGARSSPGHHGSISVQRQPVAFPAASPAAGPLSAPLRMTVSDGQLPTRSRPFMGRDPSKAVPDSPIRMNHPRPGLIGLGAIALTGAHSRKMKQKHRAKLGEMLDDIAARPLRPASRRKFLSAASIHERLCESAVCERLVDVFHKFDTDGSGEVDVKEFANAVVATLEAEGLRARREECAEVFREYDRDSSGRITYSELKETLQLKRERKKKADSEWPELPSHLMRRKHDVLQLHKQFDKQQIEDSRAKTVNLPTFYECLRLYYPKDAKEVIAVLAEWMDDILTVRKNKAEAKVREGDLALIKSIDADGNGKINITEFLALSKVTGLSKVQMRAKFRDMDLGNAGELNEMQMREVLEELRTEAAWRAERAAQGDRQTRMAKAELDENKTAESKAVDKAILPGQDYW